MARGTCLPAPVSLKKVLKESLPLPSALSLGMVPLGWMLCQILCQKLRCDEASLIVEQSLNGGLAFS